MITNLRYHIDDENILVRWNYEDIDINTVKATCRLIKRLRKTPTSEEEVVASCEHINWSTYRQNGGGCMFKMPDCPVKVVVYQERKSHDVDPVSVNIVESPHYHIVSKIKLLPVTVPRTISGGFLGLGRKTVDYWDHVSLECSLQFEGLTDEEIKSLPGWLVRGTYTHPDGKYSEIFFWPKKFELGKNELLLANLPLQSVDMTPDREPPTNLGEVKFEIPPEVTDTEYADMFLLEILPEAADAEYADMFLLDKVGESARTRDAEIKAIDLERVRPKDGKYYTVTCPFCLEEFRPHEAVFRAMSASGDDGHEATRDEVYIDFWKKKGKNGPRYTGKQGYVLDWGKGEIKSYALAENPNRIIDATGKAPSEGVVVTVFDDRGNESHEKLCPYCHNPIPVYSGFYPSLFIGMMGYTGSGKTVYMQSMIHLLHRQRLLPGYNLLCTANNNFASGRFVNKYAIWSGLSGDVGIEDDDGAMDSGGFNLGGGNLGEIGGLQMGGIGDASEGAGGSMLGGDFGAPAGGLTLGGDFGAPVGGLTLGGNSGAPVGGLTLGRDSGAPERSAGETPAANFAAEEASAAPRDAGEREKQEKMRDYYKVLTERRPVENAGRRPQTLPDATSVDYIEPCIYQLRNSDVSKGIILCFFDFPGEAINPNNTQNQDYQRFFQRLMHHFNGMIFLFDPMMLRSTHQMDQGMLREFAKFTYQAKDEKSVREMLDKEPADIVRYFQTKFTPVGQISAPIVFAISKSDAIRDHIPDLESRNLSFMDESANGAKSEHIGIDLEEIERNSAEILKFQGDEGLEDLVRTVASNYIWMCVSATGIAPKDGSMQGRFGNPVRVMEPLEWILYQNQCMTEQPAES